MSNKKMLEVILSIKDRSIFNFFTKEDLTELSE